MHSTATKITSLDTVNQRAGLVGLWREYLYSAPQYKAALLDKRFDWLYGGNPEGLATTKVATIRDALVGCASLFPRQIYFAGRTYRMGTGCDYAVAKSHRVFGPALPLQRSLVGDCAAEGYQLLMVRSNEASIGLFRRVGYQEVAPSERWVKVLRPERYAEDINNSPLAVVLSRLAARGIKVVDQVLGLPYFRGLRKLRAEILNDTDARFDALWAEASQHHRLAEVRSSAYLSWRYAKLPLAHQRFFCLFDRSDDALLGYVVFTIRDGMATIEDLLARDRGEMLERLLAAFIAAMYREEVSAISVTFLHNGLLREKLKRLLFLKRQDLHPILLYVPPEAPPELAAGLRSAWDDWFLFDGGMDL